MSQPCPAILRFSLGVSCVFFLSLFLFPVRLCGQDYFTISSEPTPAQFIQADPVLFNGPNDGFIVAWRDYRDGHEAYYGQRFGSDGMPLSNNFKIVSNEQLAFGPDGLFAAFGHQRLYNPVIELHQGFLQMYRPTGIILEPVKVTEFRYPPDFVGCPAQGSFLGFTSSGYLVGDAFNAEVKILAFDFSDQQIYSLPDSLRPGYDALGFAMTAMADGRFMFVWIGMSGDYPETTTTLYGHFFGQQGKVIADSVILETLHGLSNACDVGYTMRAMTLSDSLYQLFYAVDDTLAFLTFDPSGGVVNSTEHRVSRRPTDVPLTVRARTRRPGLSNIKNSSFDVFAGIGYYWNDGQSWRTAHQTTKYTFDVTGRLVTSIGETTPYAQIRNIRNLDDTHSQIPLAIADDIYLHNLHQLTVLDSTKINDDHSGANQRHPSVVPGPDETFLVSWGDELSVKSRLIEADGSPVGEEISIRLEAGAFFPNGEFLAIWESEDNELFTLGYRIYSQDWQVTSEEVLAQRHNDRWSIDAKIAVLGSDSFVVLLQDSTKLRMLKISRKEGVTADSVIWSGSNPSPTRLVYDQAGLLWLVWRSDPQWIWNVQAYDLAFIPRSKVIPVEHLFGGQIDFLDSGRFAYLLRQYHPEEPGIYLVIQDTLTVEPVAETRFAPYASNRIWLQALQNRYFHATWIADRTVWSQSFDIYANPRLEAIPIYSSEQPTDLQGAVAASGDKVLFVWSDAVIAGKGFDILGKTLPTALVTEVDAGARSPQQILLHPSYPNPFNPETTIAYEIPKPGHVRILIYNILGQKVATLVDKIQSQGSHRARWEGKDASQADVSSGLYVYELQFDNIVVRRKMTLLR